MIGTSHRPWLFYREGLDWRWKSFRAVAREVADTTLQAGPKPSPPHETTPAAVIRLLASGEVSTGEASTRAETLSSVLAGTLPAGEQPVVFASPSIVRALGPALAAFTLRLQAAWPLEPADDAFVATARWLRPHVVVALDGELRELADAWDDGDRKWSRLVALVRVVPAAAESQPPTNDLAATLGVPVHDVDGP